MSTPDESAAYLPEPGEIAALLRARTKDSNGTELGAWTADTRPTLEQIEELITLASAEVVAALGPHGFESDDDELEGAIALQARLAIALGTVCLVEKSYYPEQLASERSAYRFYRDEYDAALSRLTELAGGGSVGNRRGLYAMPIGTQWGRSGLPPLGPDGFPLQPEERPELFPLGTYRRLPASYTGAG